MSSSGIEIDEIGPRLQDARRASGRSLDQYAAQLCVRTGQLRALEAGKFEEFPAATYAMCMLRDYARAIGADAEALVAAFKSAQEPEEEVETAPAPVRQPIMDVPARKPGLAMMVLGLMMIGGTLVMFNQMSGTQTAKTPEVPQHLAALGKDPSNAETAAVDQVPSQTADEAAGSARTSLDGDEKQSDAPRVYAGSAAVNDNVRPASLLPAARAATPVRPQTGGRVAGSGEILLTAAYDTWISLRDGDDEVLWTGVLRAGQRFAVADNTRVSLSDAGGVRVNVGGNELGALGASRQIIEDRILTVDALSR